MAHVGSIHVRKTTVHFVDISMDVLTDVSHDDEVVLQVNGNIVKRMSYYQATRMRLIDDAAVALYQKAYSKATGFLD